MRNLLSTIFCLIIINQAAHSQLTVTPRIGFENSRTMISINDNKFFEPAPSRFTPQAGIMLDYKFKKGHGVFAGFSSGSTPVAFNFINPETSPTDYSISKSATRFRLEGGYLFNAKPIFFKPSSSKSTEQKTARCAKGKESSMKQSCGSYARSSSHCDKSKSVMAKHKAKKEMTFLRLQPQIGMAFIPSVKNDFGINTQNNSTAYNYYNAGNWNTALTAGMGFEIGKGNARFFRVNIQYLKGIGNMDNTTLTTQSGTKSVETAFASRASSWNLSLGIPISLAKKPAAKNKIQQKSEQQKKNCEQIRYRCSGVRRL